MRTTPFAGPSAGTRRARGGAGVASIAALGLLVVGAPAAHAATPTTTLAVAPAAADVTVPTPLVDYTFDDAAAGGTTIHNSGSGGSAYDGSVVNASKLGSGTRGGAATLALPGGPQGTADATMPYVTIPNGVYQGASAVTVAAWVRWDGKNAAGTPWAFILGGDKLPNNNYGVFFSPSNGGKISALANDGPEYSATTKAAIPADTWTHVAITEDGTDLVLYVNGLRTDSVPAPVDFAKLYSASSTFSGMIGRTQWSTPWASFLGGQVDDFQVFTSALDAAQVAQVAGGVPDVTGLETDAVSVTTYTGTAPELPATVSATYADGWPRDTAVAWDDVDAADFAAPGTFTVHGDVSGRAVTATVTVVAKPVGDLVAHYAFDDAAASATVADSSGNGLDATLVNPMTASVVAGADDSKALALPGGASGGTGAYVRLPKGILSGRTGLTISTRVKWSGGASWQWVYALGTSSTRYMFATPGNADGVLRSAITTAGGGAEATVTGSAAPSTNAWHTLTTTLDTSADRMTTYLDGAAVGTVATTISAADLLASTATTSGYLGKSFYADPNFAGAFDDVQIYGKALDAAQVASITTGTVPTPVAVVDPTLTVTTAVGTAPVLPLTAQTTYTDGYTRGAPVTWDDVDPDAYAQRGSFTVHGTAAGLAVTATVLVKEANQVDIDLSSNTGEFMGGAVGTLYGLYGQDIPSNNVIDGIKLRTVATKAQDGPQHPGADALEVLKPLVDSSNGDVYIYMTDIYRGFPYEWPGDTPQAKLDDFKAKIRVQVEQVASLPEKYRKHVVFVPFNEPEGNMFGTGEWSYDGVSWLTDPTEYFQAWDDVYAIIKGELPDARIAGPNTSVLFTQVQGFVTHALAAGTMPDVITWHELTNPASIRDNVAKFRTWETALYAGTDYAGKHLPINIDEYAFNYHTSVPGQMIQWISALEDAKVDGDVAYWNIDGNISDSAVQANRGNGQWWLFNAYGQMTGHTVSLVPPSPGTSYTLQGVATLDESRKRAQAIIGGASGSSLVSFSHAGTFGATAHVSVKEIGWSGQVGDSAGPQEVAELDVPVTAGNLALQFGAGDLPALDAESAYVIVVTPGANATATTVTPTLWKATYEAEDAAHTGTGWSKNGPEGTTTNVSGFYTSGGYDVGGLRTGSNVTLGFTVDVPQDGTYDLSVFANSLNTYALNSAQGPTNVFLTVDGKAEQELDLTLGYKWVVWDHTDTTVDLTAGTHTLTLAAKSLDGTRTTKGDAIVDKIDLSLANPAAAATTYEAEDATLTGAATDYTHAGVSGSGVAAVGVDDEATFWVYSKDDGEHTLTLDTLGGGTAGLAVNGQAVGDVQATSTHHVFLLGGINKVTVTGTSGTLLVDRLRVGASSGALVGTTYQAEDATTTGTAAVADYPLADGGEAVTGIGGTPGNRNTLTFDVPAKAAGTYAITVRYSNGEQSPASHYNPDPLARHADVSVNDGDATRVWFPHTFHDDNFWDLTFFVTLAQGANTIAFRSQELPSFDGTTLISDTHPDLLLRSQWAPNVDSLTVTPLRDTTAPTTTLALTPAQPTGSAGWWTGPVTATASGTDDQVAPTVQLAVDGGAWGTSASATLATDGRHTVAARATDASGNVSAVVSRDVAIDVAAPVSNASLAARTVTLRGADATSGLARIEYRTSSSGTWTTYAGAIRLGSAATTVQYRAVDVAGNVEVANALVVPSTGVVLRSSATAAVVSPERSVYGTGAKVTVRVTGSGATPTGSVRVTDGSTLVGRATLSGGKAIVVLSSKLVVGRHTLTVTYSGDAAFTGSTDTTALTVVKAASTTKVALNHGTVSTKAHATATATVKGAGTPSGKVTFTVTTKVTTTKVVKGTKVRTTTTRTVATRTVTLSSRRTAKVTLPQLPAGTYTVTARYGGSSSQLASSGKAVLTVRR